MYIHLGNKAILKKSKIIGIFDMDTATVSPVTRDFLRKSEKGKRTVNTKNEIPKSFVVTEDNSVYISQLSPSALVGRLDV